MSIEINVAILNIKRKTFLKYIMYIFYTIFFFLLFYTEAVLTLGVDIE